jgi:hypothetical protein
MWEKQRVRREELKMELEKKLTEKKYSIREQQIKGGQN